MAYFKTHRVRKIVDNSRLYLEDYEYRTKPNDDYDLEVDEDDDYDLEVPEDDIKNIVHRFGGNIVRQHNIGGNRSDKGDEK